ncbi:MAG: PIN domain-containing protein [Allosphingosinicella sp.]|uniref:PIN domain-containing protein n=1 Tax=Allosphingosinicella sp. TaxID=2823234 RepID=UPI0039264883
MKPLALIDTNVVIAAVAEAHAHHEPSLALFEAGPPGRFAVAAHSYAEAYAVLTSPAERAPFRWTPDTAWAALASVAAATRLVGLSHSQLFDTVRSFAAERGVGARLYDRAIGEAAVQHDIPSIISWNVKHMRPLFPDLQVLSPADFLST